MTMLIRRRQVREKCKTTAFGRKELLVPIYWRAALEKMQKMEPSSSLWGMI